MIFRSSLLLTTLILATLEPVLPTAGEFDILKYAITQGGLACVVLVVLWSYRRDYARLTTVDSDRLEVLTTLVVNATAALTQNAAATTQNTAATDRMARAIETLQVRQH
jgi:hypothetical protein